MLAMDKLTTWLILPLFFSNFDRKRSGELLPYIVKHL